MQNHQDATKKQWTREDFKNHKKKSSVCMSLTTLLKNNFLKFYKSNVYTTFRNTNTIH